MLSKKNIFFSFSIFFSSVLNTKFWKNRDFAWFSLIFGDFASFLRILLDFSRFFRILCLKSTKKYWKWKNPKKIRQHFFIVSENVISGVLFRRKMRLPHYYKHFRNSFSRFSTIFLKDLLIRIRSGKSCLAGKLL